MDGETVFQLICLGEKDQREELVKTYAYLLDKKRIAQRENKNIFYCSHKEVLEAFEHSASHDRDYVRMRQIFTLLQGAGIIRFRTVLPEQLPNGTWKGPVMEVYEVNKRASDEWLGIRANEVRQ